MTDPGRRQHVAVTLSGGGHRASLFGLGAMLYLIDARKGPELSNISSVSGGSLTNGYIGLRTDLTAVSPREFWDEMRPFARQVALKGSLFAYPPTYLLLAAVAIMAVPALLLSLILCPGWLALLVVVAAAFLCGALAQLRSLIAAKSFDSVFFRGAPLSDMHDSVTHVVCATELQTGLSAYFAGSFVYNYECRWGAPGDLPLARAVQASAALPGAFNVVSLPVSRHGFPGTPPISHFKLTDGGVYDNMGTEWPLRLSDRLKEDGAPADLPGADEVIVVNASGGWRGARKQVSVNKPLVGEISTLMAVKDVMYDQTTSVRRRLLDRLFRVASESGGLRGTTVQIDRSPFAVADSFTDGDDDLAKRAGRALELLRDEDRDAWDDEVKANAGAKTTLSKIPRDRAVSLMRHAYLLTAVNCHVLLGYPFDAVPERARFEQLLT